MAEILHEFPINALPSNVFAAVSSPDGLDQWWAEKTTGPPGRGAEYALGFGPGYDWRAIVVEYAPEARFTLEMTKADADWNGSRVSFDLLPHREGTWVRFSHTGWPDANEHFRISNFCFRCGCGSCRRDRLRFSARSDQRRNRA